MDASILERVRQSAVERDGRLVLPCAAAFSIAEKTGVSLAEIGAACNEQQIKIIRCQLGCFQ